MCAKNECEELFAVLRSLAHGLERRNQLNVRLPLSVRYHIVIGVTRRRRREERGKRAARGPLGINGHGARACFVSSFRAIHCALRCSFSHPDVRQGINFFYLADF